MKKLLLFTALLYFGFTQAQIVNITDVNFKQALLNHNPVIDSNNDGEIQLSEAQTTTYMNIQNKNIIDLNGIESFENLEELYGQSNSIVNFDISQNIQLKTLYASSNLVESFNLSNNLNLEVFNCSDNLLNELDLSNNINLTILSTSENLLIELDVSNNINLEEIISNNGVLTDIIGLENLTQLKVLSCRFNEIEHLNTNNCVLLELLNCQSNLFKNIDVSGNENLTKLFCQNNLELKNLNVKNGNNFMMQQLSSGYGYYVNLPLLEFVCSDGYLAYNNLVISEANSGFDINFTNSCYTSSNAYNTISGKTTYNQDNSCSNLNEAIPYLKISSTNGVNSYTTFSLDNGNYNLRTDEGTYTTTIDNLPNYYNFNPQSANSIFTGSGNIDMIDFCLLSDQNISDLNILIVPLTESRPGFDATYRIIYTNVGTTIQNGNLSLTFDDSKLTFLSATETVTSQATNELTFNFNNLNPNERRFIDVNFNIASPPTAINGQIIDFTVVINPISGDITPTDNTFILHETLIGSFDPNDIRVLEGSQVLYENRENYLHYIIRFQNTGTASAINIVVENLLEQKFDLDSFQLLNTSHSCRVAIENDNDIDFIFENINLPDSTTDEQNSHGFIAYKIKPKSTIVLGDNITNVADIYFDFNEAIVTNTVSTEFVNTLSATNFNTSVFSVHPNPVTNILNIETRNSISKVEIFNNLGQQVLSQLESNSINLSKFKTGLYFIEITDNNGNSEIKKFIKK